MRSLHSTVLPQSYTDEAVLYCIVELYLRLQFEEVSKLTSSVRAFPTRRDALRLPLLAKQAGDVR